ncbi:MAG: S1 RNA-binding domain-containing protein [Streptococcaceae bacterium]|nr:S1 RNA-binding domain-containing protein [Streptococcaceae bacterium]
MFKAKVIGIQTYGVFVSFDTDEKHGLVHISELRSGFVTAIQNEIQIGDKMDVMVIDIDEFSGKVSLSHRALEENPEKHQTTRKHYATNSREKIGFKPLEKALPTWIRENEDYLKDLENTEN